MRFSFKALIPVAGLLLATTAQAGHHLWDFTEMYSNASGSTQFVEMVCTADNEAGLSGFNLQCGANTIVFGSNLPSTLTNTTHILMATSNFAALPGGVTPDYIIPANFFPTGGGTVSYASSLHTWPFGTVPTDGIHSLLRNGSTAVNSPTNFAGTGGSVNQATAVPMVQSWGLLLLVGAMLFAASGLLRKRDTAA